MIHKIPVSAFFTIDDTFSWYYTALYRTTLLQVALVFQTKNAGLFS